MATFLCAFSCPVSPSSLGVHFPSESRFPNVSVLCSADALKSGGRCLRRTATLRSLGRKS